MHTMVCHAYNVIIVSAKIILRYINYIKGYKNGSSSFELRLTLYRLYMVIPSYEN